MVCLGGVALASSILYVHGQISSLGDGYTSFCSINDSINCDRVLTSSYANLAGIPVAWFALAAYLGLAAIFVIAARSEDRDATRKLLGLGAAGVLGSLLFSAYMGLIAVVRLETLCLLCMGLYAVALVNSGLTVAAVRSFTRSGGAAPLPPAAAAAIVVGGIGALTALAVFTWPKPTAALSSSIRTAEDVKKADPEFYSWFLALPKVDVSSILRENQRPLTREGRVVVVDFFDLECAHCRKNYLLVKELSANRSGEVEVVHRHFPLDATCNDIVPMSIHVNACRAAEAVECAGLQGKHDEMIEILFKNQGQLFAENLTRLGGKIGLDKNALQQCLDDHRTLPIVMADARAGAKLEITSTPTVFIGSHRIQGVLEEVGKYEMAVLIEASTAH